ncbi:MAG TPA: hypothetical protein VLU24_04700, partial [Mycobacterium sp.]|nr:hypothetical protein [Mycobacterium sp.]
MTGTFVLYDVIPAGTVAQNDVYLLGTHDSVPPAIAPVNATADADAIVNNGTTSVDEIKVIDPVLVPPDPLPDKSLIWSNVIKTQSAATAVNGLAGADTIINTGTAASSATDVILPGVVPTQLIGFKTSDVSSTAKATATGVDGGVDSDAITNAGTLGADASAAAAGASIQVAEASEDAGKAVLKGKVTAGATATGISGGDGNDIVTNRSAFEVTATSDTMAAGVAAVANSGKAASSAKSSSDARATGIDLGADSDTLVNDNSVTATADSTAQALNVTVDARNPPEKPTGKIAPVSKLSKLKSTSDGGAEANAHATGIGADSPATETKGDPQINFTDTGITLSYADSSVTLKPQSVTFQHQPSYAGNDSITNGADVTATATATVDAGSIGIGINGHASSKVDSKAASDAAAVDLGGGDDTLTNTGHLQATADATANALDVTVLATTTSDPPEKFWGKVAAKLDDAGEYVLSKIHDTVDAGVSADSRAVGLSADGMASDTGVKVTLSSQTDDNDATVVGLGVEVTKTHGGDGADVVTNGAAI